MDTLGVWLRKTRQAKGASLAEAADRTHIRRHLLEALEAGDFAALSGGEVQVRGFLRIYARYLEIPPEEVLARYDSEFHGREPVAEPEIPAAEEPAERMTAEDVVKTRGLPLIRSAPAWFSGRGVVGAIALVGVAAVLVLYGTGVLGGFQSGDVDDTAVPTADQPPSPTPPVPSATATPSFPIDAQGAVTVTLEATEHVWVHATTEDSILIEGMMEPGQVETWSRPQTMTVETGNGAGLLVTINGQLLGRMCGRAELCARAWAPWGEITAPLTPEMSTAGP
jgi:cytoskeleton protein RodZ